MPLIGKAYSLFRGGVKYYEHPQTYKQAKARGFKDSEAALQAFNVKLAKRRREIQAVETAYYIDRVLTPEFQNLSASMFQVRGMGEGVRAPGVRFTVDQRWKKTLSEYARVTRKTLAAATVRQASGIIRHMWLDANKDGAIKSWLQAKADAKAAILTQPVRKGGYTLAGHILLKRGSGNPLPGDTPGGYHKGGGSIGQLVFRRSGKGIAQFKSGGPGHHARLKEAAAYAIELAGKPDKRLLGYFRVSCAGAIDDAIRRAKTRFQIPEDQLQSKPITFWRGKAKVFKQGSKSSKVGLGYTRGDKFKPQLVMTIRGSIASRFGEKLLRKAISRDIDDMDRFIEKESRKRRFW